MHELKLRFGNYAPPVAKLYRKDHAGGKIWDLVEADDERLKK